MLQNAPRIVKKYSYIYIYIDFRREKYQQKFAWLGKSQLLKRKLRVRTPPLRIREALSTCGT